MHSGICQRRLTRPPLYSAKCAVSLLGAMTSADDLCRSSLRMRSGTQAASSLDHHERKRERVEATAIMIPPSGIIGLYSAFGWASLAVSPGQGSESQIRCPPWRDCAPWRAMHSGYAGNSATYAATGP